MIAHDFDFDPTCGYAETELLQLTAPEAPADFASFWENTYRETMALHLQYRLRQIWSPESGAEFYELRFPSWGGVEIGAWLARPKESCGGMVIGHGYGGIGQPCYDPKFTVIVPCIRGFNLSNSMEIPWSGDRHVLHGIDSRDGYVIRGAVTDIWRATSILLEMYPDTAGNLVYSGGSFGGGLGALALPWDRRFRAAYLDVPTFGHHPLRVLFKSTGSGESVRLYYQTHPEVLDVLRYYDAATAATFLRLPTICSPALFDPAVIPPGQFAVANSIPEEYRRRIILPTGHFDIPENRPIRAGINAAVTELFTSP